MKNTIAAFSSAKTTALFIILCLAHFYMDAMFGIWPMWKTLAGYDLLIAGILTGLSVFFGEALQSIFGRLADKGWAKYLIIAGLLGSSVCLFYPFVSFTIAALFFFFTCISSAALHPASVLIVSHLRLWKMPLMISIFQMMGFLGVACGQRAFMATFSYSQYALLLFLLIPIFLSITLSQIKTNIADATSSIKEQPSLFQAIATLWNNHALKLLYLILVTNQAIFWSILFLMPEILFEKGASQWLCFGGGSFIFVLGAAATCIPLGLLASRFDTVKLLKFLLVLSCSTIGIFVACTSFNFWSITILLFVLGGALGAVTPLALFLGTRLETKKRGLVSAFLMGGVWIVAETLGYTLSAILYSSFPPPQASYSIGLLSCLLGVGIVLSQKLQVLFCKSSTSYVNID